MKKRIIIGLSILILAILAGVFWIVKNQEKNNEKVLQEETVIQEYNQNQQEPDIEELDTSNWQIYRNEKYGFEVKYDNDWTLRESYTKHEQIGNNFCFMQVDCPNEVTGDCNNYACISVIEDLDGFNRISMEISDDPKVTGACKKNLSPLSFSESFSDIKACRRDTFGYVWDNYYFTHNNLGYVMTIRYIDPNYNPKIERAILESFKFINNN